MADNKIEIPVYANKDEVYERIENQFTYHAPKDNQPLKYGALRDSAKDLALLIVRMCPESRERSLALTNLEQAVFWANASIARNE